MRSSRRLRWTFGLIGFTMAAAVMGGAAWAAFSDDSVVYRGCYGQDGYLRIVHDSSTCKKNETSIQWNQSGPPGDPGQPGQPGQPGYRAYAKVIDWVGSPDPQLFQSQHFTSVVRSGDGAYCLLPDETLPRPFLLAPIATSSAGGARFIDAGSCEYAGVEGIGVQTWDSSGVMVNSSFNVLVP